MSGFGEWWLYRDSGEDILSNKKHDQEHKHKIKEDQKGAKPEIRVDGVHSSNRQSSHGSTKTSVMFKALVLRSAQLVRGSGY